MELFTCSPVDAVTCFILSLWALFSFSVSLFLQTSEDHYHLTDQNWESCSCSRSSPIDLKARRRKRSHPGMQNIRHEQLNKWQRVLGKELDGQRSVCRKDWAGPWKPSRMEIPQCLCVTCSSAYLWWKCFSLYSVRISLLAINSTVSRSPAMCLHEDPGCVLTTSF